jgi:hypothetical protein
MNSKLPIVRLSAVYHIGTMVPAERGKRGESLEGHLLSVSLCPISWRAIARLGGEPLHQLSKEGGATFLDAHCASRDEVFRPLIAKWACAQGLLQHRTMWKSWSTDEEGAWRYSLLPTAEAAEAETEEHDLGGPRGRGCVEPTGILAGTPTLAALVQIADLSCCDSFDYAAAIWAEQTQPGIDGLWWRDDYDPIILKAPRGGIFPGRLASFNAREIAWEQAPAEVEHGSEADQDESDDNERQGLA